MSPRDLDVLVMGEINPDIIVMGSNPVPEFGQVERLVDDIRLVIGSSSAIFACGTARLGLRTAIVGVVGDDALGRFMLESLASRGVDVSSCQIDPQQPTGATVILARGTDRALLTATGTIGALDVRTVPRSLLRRARHLHVGAYFLQRASRSHLPAFFDAAHEEGMTTSFDCNWDPSGSWDGGISQLLASTDLFLPNAAEALLLTRQERVADAARELASRRTPEANLDPTDPSGREQLTVVVKCGADGALAVRGDEVVLRPALPVAPLDATGAGDTFDAGFVFAWLSDMSLARSVEFAAACGSLSTERVGGTDGQPTVAQARAALRRFQVSGW